MNRTIDKRSLAVWSFSLPPPDADARRLIENFETLDAARAEGKRRARMLGQGNQTQRRLAKELKGCRLGRRCYLSICPVCQRQTRLWLIGQTLVLMAEDEAVFVTVIPSDTSVDAGRLAEVCPQRLLNRVRKQLRRCGYHGPLVGAVDGTYESDRGEFQVHLHFIAIEGDRQALDRFALFYPTTPTGSAGVVIKPVQEARRASTVGYCLKTFWVERVRFCGGSGKLRSQKRRLAVEQAREWLEWQANYPTASLILLYGLRRRGDTLCRLRSAPALRRAA
jgi:hypothetical protein